MNKTRNASCIKRGCGKQFDKSIPETRDSRTLRPFWQRYCPEHRVNGKTYEPIVEVPVKPAILDCGHPPSEHSENTTGTARTSDNKEICWTCAALGELGHMLKTGKATLYWSNTKQYGWRVTNWPSSLMFDHVRATTGKHNIGGTRDDVWFVGPDGYIWHGVQIGQWNQILHARRTKERTALPFNAVKEF